jgi:hypothetical protein
MWRKSVCAAGGLFVVCTAAYIAPSSESAAQPANFDARWLAIASSQKADRFEWDRTGSAYAKVHFFNLPALQTTVVVKDRVKPSERSPLVEDQRRAGTRTPVHPVRVIPNDSKARDKLPVGCESSFSPVTTPVMANVSGRCVS